MINKSSQIQMMETVIILFIFFILLVFGFVFYSRFFTSGMEMEKKENIQLRAVQIAQRVADLPEIQCTKNNVRVDNCLDFYKLEVIYDNNIMTSPSNSIHYFDMLGFSTVTIKQVHPPECSDGFDNDGDTKIDYGLDDTCTDGFCNDMDCGNANDVESNTNQASVWTLYNKDLTNPKTTSSIFIPTIIYNPADTGYCYIGQGSCSFGLIEVKVYS